MIQVRWLRGATAQTAPIENTTGHSIQESTMNAFRRPAILALALAAILAGCAGTQANTTHNPDQGNAAQAQQPQQPTNVPF